MMLPATVKITYIPAVVAESSENLTESIANVDMVVNAPSSPVPMNMILPSLMTVPAAMTPNNTPNSSEPTRFTPNVA